jgi:hypothetical protein
MSKITNRATAPGDRGSVENRLERLLDTPFFARVVPHLPPETLHQLIRYRGLDACGELVTSATPAQLTSLLDLDLWRPARPGRDGQFDVDRFGEWLEMLVDTGPSVAARTVAALDTNVVVAGLSRYVRVFDLGIFEPTAQSDDEPMDRQEAMREGDVMDVDGAMHAESMHSGDAPTHDSSGDGLECEVGGYIVRARRADAWDAIVTLLVALDAEHGNDFQAVMQGCRRLSNSIPEIDGLDDLLRAPEQHLHDVAGERERRQSQQGYATPADARAFLQMARQPTRTQSGASAAESMKAHPIVAAYFRAAEEAPESSNESTRSSERLLESSASRSPASRSPDGQVDAPDVAESIAAVIGLLTEAGLMPERPRALLEAADPRADRLTRVRQLLACARDEDEAAYFTRSGELAFLGNALLAGCSVQSRPFTPPEASDAAASICNLGLEYWPERWPGVTLHDASSPRARSTTNHLRRGSGGQAATPRDTFPPDSFLIDHDLVTAFTVGWSVLYQDVSVFVAHQLISMLDDLRCVDADIQRGFVTLRRQLARQRDAGTPWLARDAADVLAMLDMTAWISVRGLLDECPVVPAALTAILERRTTPVSQTAFDFISTAAQIGDIRTFMRKLPAILSR